MNNKLIKKIKKAIRWERACVTGEDANAYRNYASAIVSLGEYIEVKFFPSKLELKNESESPAAKEKRRREFIKRQLNELEILLLLHVRKTYQSEFVALQRESTPAQRIPRQFIKHAWDGVEVEDKRIASNTHWNKASRDYFESGLAALDIFCSAKLTDADLEILKKNKIEDKKIEARKWLEEKKEILQTIESKLVQNEEINKKNKGSEIIEEKLLPLSKDEENLIQQAETKCEIIEQTENAQRYSWDQCATYHDNLACRAIQHYKTQRQKILEYKSIILSAFASVGYGFVIAISLLGIHFTLPLFILAMGLFICISIGSFITLRGNTYSFLNAFFGKDKIFEGLTEYVNDNGRISQLSMNKIKFLPIFIFIGSTVGLAQLGFFAYHIFLMHQMANLTWLTIGATSSALFPVAIAIVVATIVCFTALMFKELLAAQRENDFKSFLLRPFRGVKKTIDDHCDKNNIINQGIKPELLQIKKGFLYFITAAACAVSVGGLFGLSVASTNSFTLCLMHYCHLAAIPAQAVSISLNMVISNIPETAFHLATSAECVEIGVKCSENVNHTKDELIQESINKTTLLERGALVFCNMTSAIGSGLLVAVSIHGMIANVIWGTVTGIFLGISEAWNNAAPVITEEEDTDDENEHEVAECQSERMTKWYQRITQALGTSDSNNPSAGFENDEDIKVVKEKGWYERVTQALGVRAFNNPSAGFESDEDIEVGIKKERNNETTVSNSILHLGSIPDAKSYHDCVKSFGM